MPKSEVTATGILHQLRTNDLVIEAEVMRPGGKRKMLRYQVLTQTFVVTHGAEEIWRGKDPVTASNRYNRIRSNVRGSKVS